MVEQEAQKQGPRSRRSALLREITKRGSVRIEELVELFGVSAMTIHRDLDFLAKMGKIERFRGGARVTDQRFSEHDVTIRRATNRMVKVALAKEASSLLKPGDIVGLDDSTTVGAMLPYVVDANPSGVITHSLAVMRRLADSSVREGFVLTGVGGRYVAATDSFLGTSTCRALGSLKASISFVSTTSISSAGLYHPDEDAALTKTALINLATRKVLVTDSSKFANQGMHFVSSLQAFDDIVVDDHLDGDIQEALSKTGANLHVVDTPEPEPTQPAPPLLK